MLSNELFEELKNACKKQNMNLWVNDPAKPKYGYIAFKNNNSQIYYWQESTWHDGLYFSICTKANKETGTGWRINEEPIYDFSNVEFDKLLNDIIPACLRVKNFSKINLLTVEEKMKEYEQFPDLKPYKII